MYESALLLDGTVITQSFVYTLYLKSPTVLYLPPYSKYSMHFPDTQRLSVMAK
jgi:hypothetical protein